MYSTREEIEEFFDQSLVWMDIRDLLNEGIALGVEELENPEIVDIMYINHVRGGIQRLRTLLDLKSIMLERLTQEKDDGERGE